MITALMAYPGRREENERRDAYEALVARALYEHIRLTRDGTPFQNPRLNRYLELKSDREASLISRRVSKILGRRSEIGGIAAPWILRLSGTVPDVPALTDTVLEDRVALLLPGRDPEMWVKRTWRPSKPAFHLFAAYYLAALLLPAEAKDPFNPISSEFRAPDGHLTPIVAKTAMDLQQKLVSDTRFPFQIADLVWLEWNDD